MILFCLLSHNLSSFMYKDAVTGIPDLYPLKGVPCIRGGRGGRGF